MPHMNRYNIVFCATPEEKDHIERLVKERGFENRQHLIRTALNCYLGEEVFIFRPDPKKRVFKPTKQRILKVTPVKKEKGLGGWTFDGGLVVTSTQLIHVYLENPPDIDTRLKLRFMHFVPLNNGYEWKAEKSPRTLREIFNLYPEKD